MRRTLVLLLLVAGLAAATSPVWAADPGNPSFSPDPASPGQTASFVGSLPDVGLGPDSCDVTASDGSTPAYSCFYDDAGTFSGWVVVPSSATPGTSYVFVFCGPAPECATVGKSQWTATNGVSVATSASSSPARLVTVPTLHCVDYVAGSSRLTAEGLAVGSTPFSGAIGRVQPSGGSVVRAGSTVTPYPPRVPDVVALSLAAATPLVTRACGLASAVGTGGVVLRQSPSAGADLPSDQQVTLMLDEVPPPPPPPWREILVVAGVVLLVAIATWWGARHSRRGSHTRHPPEEVLVSAGPVGLTYPPVPSERELPDPDLVVLRYPTTYWMEGPP
jgi:hypothetical protein